VSRAPDLTPITAGERLFVTFDFAPDLASGETLITVDPVVCSVVLGADADADARIIGNASIAISPSTRVADCAVRQLIGDMIAGARYKLLCTAETSGDQTLAIEVCIDCNS
jgi:hypothetical protein